MSRRKNQRIPDSIWNKLMIIQAERPWWPMTTVINECLEIGTNWYIKGMAKKKRKDSGDQTEPLHERTETILNQKQKEELEENIRIANIEWVEK